MDIKRNALLSSGGLGDGHGDTENGVGTKLALVWGSIEFEKELVDSGLVLTSTLAFKRAGAMVSLTCVLLVPLLLVPRALKTCVLDSLEDTLATPLLLVTIAELDSLVGTSRGTRWDNGAVKTGLGDEVLEWVSTCFLRSASNIVLTTSTVGLPRES